MRYFASAFRSDFVRKMNLTIYKPMKPTFRPVVYAHHKRKDGTYNVKINVYFKGKERRLPTTIYCTKNDLTRTFHLKQGDALSKANTEIIKMQKAVSDISFFDLEEKDVDWLVAKIKAKLKKVSFRLDFFQYAESFIAGKKEATASTYRSAVNAFAAFLGKRSIDINDISRPMLVEFMEWWNKQPIMVWHRGKGQFVSTERKRKSMHSSTIHVSKLSVIFHDAKQRYNDEDNEMILIPRSPFDKLPKVNIQSDGQEALSPEVMQKIIFADVPARRPAQRKALDVFLLSFCCMGMNMADLIEAGCPEGDVLEYQRKKTRDKRQDRAFMRIDLQPETKIYAARLGAKKGGKWLPELLAMSKDEQRLTSRINASLKAWCEAEGIKPFSFYAARKTWATLARTVAEKSLVDECLAHVGDYRLTDIYAVRPWDKINEVNRKVLDLLEWPQ